MTGVYGTRNAHRERGYWPPHDATYELWVYPDAEGFTSIGRIVGQGTPQEGQDG